MTKTIGYILGQALPLSFFIFLIALIFLKILKNLYIFNKNYSKLKTFLLIYFVSFTIIFANILPLNKIFIYSTYLLGISIFAYFLSMLKTK